MGEIFSNYERTAKRALALNEIAEQAEQNGDSAAQQAAREAIVAIWREAGEDQPTLLQLSVALFNLAAFYGQQQQYAVAIELLEEVVALDQRTNHADLTSDQAELEAMRQLAANLAEPTFADAIAEWRKHGRDEEQLLGLLNLACALFVEAMRNGSLAERAQFAADIVLLTEQESLPLAGTADFLHVLQLYLQVDPALTERIAQLEATLPDPFIQAMYDIQQAIAEPCAAGQLKETKPTETTNALGNFSPEQQAELAVAAQITPLLEQAIAMLRQPGSGSSQRFSSAEQLEATATQVATGEPADSPWMRAAHTLRLVAHWLRGNKPDLTMVQQPYQGLIMLMVGGE